MTEFSEVRLSATEPLVDLSASFVVTPVNPTGWRYSLRWRKPASPSRGFYSCDLTLEDVRCSSYVQRKRRVSGRDRYQLSS